MLGRHQLGEALQRRVRGQQRGRILARRPAAPGRDPAQTQQQGISLGCRDHPDQLDTAEQSSDGAQIHRGESGQPGHPGRQVGTRRPRTEPGQQTRTGVVHVDAGEIDEQSAWAVLGQDRRDGSAEEQRAGPVRDRAALHGRTTDPADGQHGVGSAGRPLDGQAVPDRALQDGRPNRRRWPRRTPDRPRPPDGARRPASPRPAHAPPRPTTEAPSDRDRSARARQASSQSMRSRSVGGGWQVPTMDWTTSLADQVDWHWTAQARPRLDGLTDRRVLLGAGRRLLEHPTSRRGGGDAGRFR